MSRILLIFTLCVLSIVACSLVSATKFHSRPTSPNAIIENVFLNNGKTLTRVRQHRSTTNKVGTVNNNKKKEINVVPGADEPTIPVPTASPTPSFVQPKRMIFVISSYCNSSLLTLTNQATENGGWVVVPPATMPSFYQGEYTGFEIASNPGQQVPTFNGTFAYSMNSGDLQVSFFAGLDEFGVEIEWMTSWQPMIFPSEYSDIAVYNLVLGDPHFTDKPIC